MSSWKRFLIIYILYMAHPSFFSMISRSPRVQSLASPLLQTGILFQWALDSHCRCGSVLLSGRSRGTKALKGPRITKQYLKINAESCTRRLAYWSWALGEMRQYSLDHVITELLKSQVDLPLILQWICVLFGLPVIHFARQERPAFFSFKVVIVVSMLFLEWQPILARCFSKWGRFS